jgi:hypothetical protein
VARAKHTGRAEARRRYRQAVSQPDALASDELDEAAPATTAKPPAAGPRAAQPRPTPARPAAAPSGRPGFLAAFRGAYHPAHFREDLTHVPKLLTSRALLAGIGLVLVGGVAAYAFPNYTGSAFAWELLVLPGSALAPQLVAGFFAPRASYILGFIVGLAQGLVFTLFLTQFADRLGTQLPADRVGSLLTLSFVTGPVSGLLFAAAAAWYRRFLALSSPRRGQAGGRPTGKAAAKPNAARRPAGR